jgi:predicted nucleic acid-binding protein
MTLVSNTSPLCYLVLIGHAEVLPKLYGSAHVTQKVLEELRHPDAPPLVRDWAAAPPGWLNIHSDPAEPDTTLAALDPGERTALRLAEQLHADAVLLDDSAARALAVQRRLKVSGTLGVLCDAAQAGLLNLPATLDLLRKTNFRASPELWKMLYTRQSGA